MCRKYDIGAVGGGGLHKLCYLQIVICWQGLCHDTLLTYLLHLLQESRAAASNLLQPAHCLLLFHSYQHQHAPGCDVQTLTFPPDDVALLERNKYVPGRFIFHVLLTLPGRHDRLFLPAADSFDFTVLLPRRLPLRSDLGKWNVVIEEKVQIGSGCKWSLVSGRRFLFRR